jgi:hypothetical protein
MKGYVIPVLTCLLLVAGSMLAQKVRTGTAKEKQTKAQPAAYASRIYSEKEDQAKARPNVKAYLGRSDMNDGFISKKVFDSLLKQGLTARDSSGNPYKVDIFTFGFAAHNLYEDSVGNPIIMTDYFSEVCIGDTVSRAIAVNVYEYNMTKPGDTAYFDNIKVSSPETGQMAVKPMRFVLRK